MTDIARLGIEVQTGDVTKAGAELDKFVQAGEKAEKAAEGIGQSFDKASTAATGLSGAETKLAETTEEARTATMMITPPSIDLAVGRSPVAKKTHKGFKIGSKTAINILCKAVIRFIA